MRRNVQYSVYKVASMKDEERRGIIHGYINTKLDKYLSRKLIIYSNTVGEVQRIAKELDYQAYFYNVKDKEAII